MTSWPQVVSLAENFQKSVEAQKFDHAESLLASLKKLMLELDSLPPMGLETANAAEERRVFARVLEHAVILSIGQQDKFSFQKYITSLRPYYTQYGLADSHPSNVTYMVLGLNLLYLLVENRLADFHCELELLSSNSRNHPAIVFCTQLEKHLVVGSYDSILTAAANPPVAFYSFFLVSLMETVRSNIGECLSAAYTSIEVDSATRLLMFNQPMETVAFVQENFPEWKVENNKIYISSETKVKKASEIHSLPLIAQTLSYATELDRIV